MNAAPSADPSQGGRPAVLFVAMQTGAMANGGIASMGEVMTGLRRFRPMVLTNLESRATARWRAMGMTVQVCPEQASRGIRSAPIASLRTYWRYFSAVRTILIENGVRIVHANDPLAFQLSLAAVRSVPGARIVLNLRDTLDPERSAPAGKFRLLFGAADRVLMLSQDMLARWNALAPIAGGKASHTYSIVDFERFLPSAIDPASRRRVLVSGIASPKKGQLFYLREVAPTLAAAGITTVFSGDFDPQANSYAAECLHAAEPLGRWVEFRGYCNDMPGLMQSVGCVCISSSHEGLMRSMIEAMAAGRPVVSTDVSSAREMLEQPGRPAGRVRSPSDPQAFARSIIELCDNPPLAGELGANGAAIARELFAADRVIAAYEDCYASLAAAGTSAGT